MIWGNGGYISRYGHTCFYQKKECMKKRAYYCIAFSCISFCHAESSAIERLREWYNKLLLQEETALKNELYAALGVSSLEYEQLKTSLRNPYYRTWHTLDLEQEAYQKPFSNHIQAIIDRVVSLYDPEKNILFLRNDAPLAGVETRAFTIFISESYLQKYCMNDLEIEATILHEVMHIHHEDAFEREVFNILTAMHPRENEQELQALQKKLFHFHEKRADIQTCLLGTRYAQTRSDNFKRLMFSDIPSGDTHPLHATRAEYMGKIAYELQAMHIAETYLKK